MSVIYYFILLPIIFLLSLLPFKVLYLISDVSFYIIYYIIKYRKKVVITNLKNSFPNKSDSEIERICKNHYKYFCDLILEIIKTLTITSKAVNKHVNIKNISLYENYLKQNQSVIIVLGHFGNWELSGAAFGVKKIHELFVIYHPLKNKQFNNLLYHMRTRLGNKLYAMNETLRGMLQNRNKITATAFIADQTPLPQNAHWTTFLNQETPIFTGIEKIAKKFNYPVIYSSTKRIKRGYYEVDSEILFDKPLEAKENEITEGYTKRLEQDIINQPEIWLWTHRRWKHKKEQIQ